MAVRGVTDTERRAVPESSTVPVVDDVFEWDFETMVDVAGSIETACAREAGAAVGSDVIESDAEQATSAVQPLSASRVRR